MFLLTHDANDNEIIVNLDNVIYAKSNWMSPDRSGATLFMFDEFELDVTMTMKDLAAALNIINSA